MVIPYALLLCFMVFVLIVYLRSDPGSRFQRGEGRLSVPGLMGLIVALGFGLAFRMTTPSEVSDLGPRGEAINHDLASRSLARGDGFTISYRDRTYDAPGTIGFPLLTAATRVATGQIDTAGMTVLVACFAGALVIALAFFLGHEIGGNRGAVAAAFLTALSPFQIYHSRQPLPDTTALAFLLGALLLGIRWLRLETSRPRHFALVGLLSGLGSTVHFACFTITPLIALFAIGKYGRDKRRKSRTFAALTLGCLVGMAPQLIINHVSRNAFWRSCPDTATLASMPSTTEVFVPSSHVIDEEGATHFRAYAAMLAPTETLKEDRERLIELGNQASEPKLLPRSLRGKKQDPQASKNASVNKGDAGPASAAEGSKSPRKKAKRKMLDRVSTVKQEGPVEPRHLYPFVIFLLALIGFGVSADADARPAARRSLLVLVLAGAVCFVYYGLHRDVQARYLLPVQTILLVFAGRAFTTQRRALRIGVTTLAVVALWSALPGIADAMRPVQGNAPRGRANEERLLLRDIAKLEPGTLLMITHGILFEEELLERGFDWVPLSADEHRLRLSRNPFGGQRDRDVRRELEPRYATYQRTPIDLPLAAARLLRDIHTGEVDGRALDDEDRDRIEDLLDAFPMEPPYHGPMSKLRLKLNEGIGVEADQALLRDLETTCLAILAWQLDERLAMETRTGRPFYFLDHGLYQFGFLEGRIRKLILDTEERRTLVNEVLARDLESQGRWELVTTLRRAGFARQDQAGEAPLYRYRTP